jgi:hypothetical protein
VSGPIRVVMAVVVAMALLGGSLAAVERARDAHAATRLDDTTTDLAGTAARLADRNDPTHAGDARVLVGLRVPTGGSLRVVDGHLEWRIGGGPWHRRHPSVAVRSRTGQLRLAPGRHRLRLTLHRRGGRRSVVVVSRATGD